MGDQPTKNKINSTHVTLTPCHVLTDIMRSGIVHTLNFTFSLSLTHTENICFNLHTLNIPVVSYHSNPFFPTWLFTQHDKLSPNSVAQSNHLTMFIHDFCDSRIQEELIRGLQLGPPLHCSQNLTTCSSLLKVPLD